MEHHEDADEEGVDEDYGRNGSHHMDVLHHKEEGPGKEVTGVKGRPSVKNVGL